MQQAHTMCKSGILLCATNFVVRISLRAHFCRLYNKKSVFALPRKKKKIYSKQNVTTRTHSRTHGCELLKIDGIFAMALSSKNWLAFIIFSTFSSCRKLMREILTRKILNKNRFTMMRHTFRTMFSRPFYADAHGFLPMRR